MKSKVDQTGGGGDENARSLFASEGMFESNFKIFFSQMEIEFLHA